MTNFDKKFLLLVSVVSLHTELRNVNEVQEHTCTQSTGVYTKYRDCTWSTRTYQYTKYRGVHKCTQSMGIVQGVQGLYMEYQMYKLVRGVQAFYELCNESPQPDDDLYDTESLQPYPYAIPLPFI